ncbi:MAG TPA: beta-propeller fold lactonase family protein [Streptosporangiaceae bacterium]|nr:beta-propeller fold lactonase family protein [Streptosporangiaceae bacterium]
MKPISKVAAVTVAGAAVAALSALPASAATADSRPGQARAVFVQTDNSAGNTVVAYARTASGGLQQVGSYPTGGNGGATNGSVADHLSSQGSLAYDRPAGLLYAVNAGSNTITVFRVRGDRLFRSQVISSGGQFPVSVTFHGDQVFVLNAWGGASVAGFLQIGGYLLPVPSWTRDLGLGTSSSTVFTGTPGQVGFTPDGSQLVVTTKNAANTVDVFADGLFGPSARPAVTSLPGTIPFGFTFDAYGHLALVETGAGAVATFTIAPDGTLTQLGSVATGQAATCWITAAPEGTMYASNAGSGTESILATEPDGAITQLGTAATDAGTTDAVVSSDGQYLYVQAGGPGNVDAYRIGPGGTLTETGSVTVPGAVGGEGIAAS